MRISIPHICPNKRHKIRFSMRNSRELFSRKCDNCETEISTTYHPENPDDKKRSILCE